VVDKTSKKVDFKPVETGIQGSTDIEVTSGVNEGDEIVSGPFKVLRNLKLGTKIKVDNSIAKKDDGA
jgi:HlyD family secretion protein